MKLVLVSIVLLTLTYCTHERRESSNIKRNNLSAGTESGSDNDSDNGFDNDSDSGVDNGSNNGSDSGSDNDSDNDSDSKSTMCSNFSLKRLTVPIKKQDLLCLDDVKHFLDVIPDSMRNYYLFIHDSQSSQSTSSDRFPRLIMYSPTGRTIVGITTDPSDRNRETVEFAQLDQKTGHWDFFSHNFAEGVEELRLKGSEACMPCHGNTAKSIRPIWNSYQKWPTAISSWKFRQEVGGDLHGLDEPLAKDLMTTNATLALSPQGASGLTAIYKNRKNSDRFHTLQFKPPSETGSNLREKLPRPPDTYLQGDVIGLPTDAYSTINIVFGLAMVPAQANGINLKLKQHKDYSSLLPALILSSSLCGYKKGQNNKLDALLTKIPYKERYEGQDACFSNHLKLQEAMGLDVVVSYRMGSLYSELIEGKEPCSNPDGFSNGFLPLKSYLHANWLAEYRTRSTLLDAALKGIGGDIINIMNRVIFQSDDKQSFEDMKSGVVLRSPYTYGDSITKDSVNRDAICSAILNSI